jgi:hypothetical protein
MPLRWVVGRIVAPGAASSFENLQRGDIMADGREEREEREKRREVDERENREDRLDRVPDEPWKPERNES